MNYYIVVKTFEQIKFDFFHTIYLLRQANWTSVQLQNATNWLQDTT